MKLSIKMPAQGEPRSLETSVKKQLTDFSKNNSSVEEADVKLVYGADRDNDKVCEIYLKAAGKNIFAIQRASSFEASTGKAIAKLQGQLDQINKPI